MGQFVEVIIIFLWKIVRLSKLMAAAHTERWAHWSSREYVRTASCALELFSSSALHKILTAFMSLRRRSSCMIFYQAWRKLWLSWPTQLQLEWYKRLATDFLQTTESSAVYKRRPVSENVRRKPYSDGDRKPPTERQEKPSVPVEKKVPRDAPRAALPVGNWFIWIFHVKSVIDKGQYWR
jgi:hypothetical protein